MMTLSRGRVCPRHTIMASILDSSPTSDNPQASEPARLLLDFAGYTRASFRGFRLTAVRDRMIPLPRLARIDEAVC